MTAPQVVRWPICAKTNMCEQRFRRALDTSVPRRHPQHAPPPTSETVIGFAAFRNELDLRDVVVVDKPYRLTTSGFIGGWGSRVGVVGRLEILGKFATDQAQDKGSSSFRVQSKRIFYRVRMQYVRVINFTVCIMEAFASTVGSSYTYAAR